MQKDEGVFPIPKDVFIHHIFPFINCPLSLLAFAHTCKKFYDVLSQTDQYWPCLSVKQCELQEHTCMKQFTRFLRVLTHRSFDPTRLSRCAQFSLLNILEPYNWTHIRFLRRAYKSHFFPRVCTNATHIHCQEIGENGIFSRDFPRREEHVTLNMWGSKAGCVTYDALPSAPSCVHRHNCVEVVNGQIIFERLLSSVFQNTPPRYGQLIKWKWKWQARLSVTEEEVNMVAVEES